jgi:hypothetical protein
MVKCIVSISNKMQRYTVYLYLETALHVSGSTTICHQERIQLYLQHLVFVTPLLLSAAIVEELEPVCVCCGWRMRRLCEVRTEILCVKQMNQSSEGYCSGCRLCPATKQ